MSTVGGVEYTGPGDIMSTPGDTTTNVGEGHWENNLICMGLHPLTLLVQHHCF